MPQIKSAKKRVLQSEKRRCINMARKSAIKTAVKKVVVALDSNEATVAQELLSDVQSQMARAAGKGVMHRNAVARRMSRLAKKVAAAKRAESAAA